ncbi:MAG: hypothetical protein LBT56_08560, partial [Prevotellaceae bacterium]|nr:hypothetical protein [Prevotellaceae bacterium]
MYAQQQHTKSPNKRKYLLLLFFCMLFVSAKISAQENDTILKIQNTANGIIRPDYELSFVIPENPLFVYDSITGNLMVYDNSTSPPTQVGEQKLNGNGTSVFPITVKDKDGNIYKLTEGTETDENGNKIINSEYLGKQGAPLTADNFDANALTPNTAIARFDNAAESKYAIDEFDEKFSNSNRVKDKYTKLGDYNVLWKFLPEGGNDKIQANITLIDNTLDADKIIFQTPQGTIYEKKKIAENQYELTIIAGADNDVQQIYALYPASANKFHTLGRIDVVTYTPQTAKLVVVSVNGNSINTNDLKTYLNGVYNGVGVKFEIETDAFTYENAIHLFDESSGWFSRYTAAMKAFNNAYKNYTGANYDKNKNYLFVLDKDQSNRSDRDALGFMPLGGRFGYLFTENLSANQINDIAAHELGHGVWALKHTFDNDYGDISVNTTDNLMDYTEDKHHLAKWQWEIIRYPALFTDPFGGDDEGEFSWIIIDIKHTKLLNYVYNKNLKTYNDTETTSYKTDEWEKEWKYNTTKPNEIVNNVIQTIKSTDKNNIIGKITLSDYGIYIGKHIFENKEYPVAVYSRKKNINNIKKTVIKARKDLINDDIKKHIYAQVYIFDYAVLAFYEEGYNEPILILQTPAKADGFLTIYLMYLGILTDSRNIELDNVRWIGQFSSEINGRNCHWCGQSGSCCNGGTPCSTCPNDSTKKCCEIACTDILEENKCDFCTNETICDDNNKCKSNNCCFQTSLAMIEQFGLTTDRNQAIDIATLISEKNWKEQSDLQTNAAKFEESITYIDETLNAGNPILIGVHYKNTYSEPYNKKKATF